MNTQLEYGHTIPWLVTRVDISLMPKNDRLRLCQDLLKQLMLTDLLTPEEHQDMVSFMKAVLARGQL